MFRRIALSALTAATLATFAHAQSGDVLQYRDSDRVDPRDVARILGAPQQPEMKMRSIRLKEQPAPAVATEAPAPAVAAPAPVAPSRPHRYAARATETRTDAAIGQPSALSVPVKFAFDSATILPQARPQLDAIAEGIRMLPDGHSVTIEGHTDAAGPDAYNQHLSERRAQAVKQYLISVHQIDAARLKTRGYGETQPLHEVDPHSPDNRRVQFRGG